MDASKLFGSGGGFTPSILTNQEQIFSTSGAFAAPKSGKYVVLCLGGGAGGCAVSKGINDSSAIVANGGRSSFPVEEFVELSEGEVCSIIIGSGGSGGAATSSPKFSLGGKGGSTIFLSSSCVVVGEGGQNPETGSGSASTGLYNANQYTFVSEEISSVALTYNTSVSAHTTGVDLPSYQTYYQTGEFSRPLETISLWTNPATHSTGMKNTSHNVFGLGGCTGLNDRGGNGSAVDLANTGGGAGIGYGSGGGGAGCYYRNAWGGSGGDGVVIIMWYEE